MKIRTGVNAALLVASMTAFAGADAANNPDWPAECGSQTIGDPHEIVSYLRFYPSKRTAKRNTVLHDTGTEVLPFGPKNDNYDILTGFVTENATGTFRHVVYISDPIIDGKPLSIIVPFWFRENAIDIEDFKLRRSTDPRLYDPDSPDDTSMRRGGGMHVGAINYRCIVKIGKKRSDGFRLVYLQGYISRESNLSSYFNAIGE